MLTVRVLYTDAHGREMSVIESRSDVAVRDAAEGMFKEYADAARACPDRVIATLIDTEAFQATELIRAAGLAIEERPQSVR